MEWPRGSNSEAEVETVARCAKTDTYVPDDGNRYPTLRISWDQTAWRYSITDCVEELRAGDPVIEVLGADNPSLVRAVPEGNPDPTRKERKGTQPHRIGFHDRKGWRRNRRRTKVRAILGAQKKSAA